MNVGTLEIKLLANMARLQADMDKASNSVDRAMRGIDKSVGVAKRALGGLTSALGVAQVLKAVDEYKKFDAQLKLSARTAQEYAAAYGDVVRISRTSQSDIAAVGNLYARLALNMRDAGIAQDQVSRTTEAITLALRVKNATVQETNSVMLQLSQSFGSGRLNGQEFLAVAEGAPPLLQRLAKSMNVPFGALKDLSAQGKITRDELLKAFSDPEYIASLREQVKEVGTISSAFVVLINNVKQFLGEQDKAIGASKILQQGILGVADSLGLLIRAGLVVGAIAFGRLAASMYDTVKAQQAAIAADTAAQAKKVQLARASVLLAQENYKVASSVGASTLAINNNAAATTNAARAAAALTAAQGRLATATATASVAVRAFGTAVAFLGGPVGIAIGLIVLFGDKIVEWMNKTRGMTPALQEINDELERQNRLKREGISINDPMAEEKSKVAQLQEQIKQLSDARARYQAIAKDPSIATAMERERLAGLGVANAQVVQSRAAEAARKESDKLRVAYDLLTKASAKMEAPVNTNVATFAMLTGELKLASAAKAEYAAQSQAIIDAAKREGKSQAELAEALAALRAKLLKSEVKADNAAYKERLKELQAEIEFEQEAQTTSNKRAQEEQEERNKQILKDLQDQIDFEEDQRQVQWKAENDAREDRIKEEKRAAKEIAAAQKAEFERIQESISRAISNGLLDGFENGKSILENFKDVAIRTLKLVVVQPMIERIIAGPLKAILGALGSLGVTNTAFAGGEGLVASGGGIEGVFGTIREGLSSLNTNVVGSIEKLGVFLSNGNGGLADKIGGFFGQYSSQIATSLAFAPAVLSLLKGDIKGAAFQGAGAGIGLALGGPVGGAIGSFLGGALGSVFGGKTKNPRKGAGVSSTYLDGQFSSFATKGGAKKFTADLVDPLTNLNRAFSDMLGGYMSELGLTQQINVNSLFATKSKKRAIGGISGTIGGVGFGGNAKGYTKDAQQSWQQFADEVFGPVMVQAIQASGLSAGIKALFSGMTDKTQIMAMMNATISLNKEQAQLADRYAITVNQAAMAASATGLAGDALVGMVNKLAGAVQTTGSVLMQARESLIENMGGRQLPTTLKAFDDILRSIDKSTQAGIQSFADLFQLREQFSAFTQSIDELRGGVNNTLMPFLTAQEQQAIRMAELTKVFDSLNMAVPGSLEELIALGKGIDYTTKEGLDLASVFPSLVQAFQNATGAAQDLIDAMRGVDDFRTRAEYQIYSGLYKNYGASMAESRFPSYDVGTDFVPNDGLAMIHRGERIIPADENAAMMQGGGSIVMELQALRAELRAVVSATNRTAMFSKRTADRIERVSPNGDAFQTEALA
jgi:tape measure domain-containing protein